MLTEQEKEYIRLYYPVRYSQKIAEDLGIEKSIINNFAKEEELKKVKKNTYIIEGKKLCGRCNKWVDLDGFHKSKNLVKHPSGYQDWCITCHRQYTKDNKDKFDKYKERNKKKQDFHTCNSTIEENKTTNENYKCKMCGEIKLGKEFSFVQSRMKRDCTCRECRKKVRDNNKIKKIQQQIKGDM